MDFLDQLARRFNVTPATIIPQQHTTSRELELLTAVPVKLLVGPLPLPIMKTKMGVPCKRQPKPMQVGENAYIKLQVDGLVNIYPFSLAGQGYELVRDARESVHYTFI